ncbi:hypothetical protein H4Q26_009695 [Puccinia striiformis f. sp. tritici PST-130]|nr:hypothetical protein H4Q26_009695 [Puccinia striiformis f. sp. tritici PST-130]
MKDEGNTNYSIMMTRESFDRSTNTRIVSQAIQEMGIPKVDITDRYDNIVDSKAVGSVRSPVTSLIKNSNTYNTQKEVNHVQFMNTLSREFTRHYYPNSDRCLSKTQVLGETELQTNPIIKTGYDELKSWNWIYGQTPQFTRRIEVEIDDTKNHQIPVEITYKNGICDLFPIGNPIDF